MSRTFRLIGLLAAGGAAILTVVLIGSIRYATPASPPLAVERVWVQLDIPESKLVVRMAPDGEPVLGWTATLSPSGGAPILRADAASGSDWLEGLRTRLGVSPPAPVRFTPDGASVTAGGPAWQSWELLDHELATFLFWSKNTLRTLEHDLAQSERLAAEANREVEEMMSWLAPRRSIGRGGNGPHCGHELDSASLWRPADRR